MGLGYTTIMYDPREVVETGIGDVAACRYDGLEIGLGKLRKSGPETVDDLLDEYDLDLYCVMAGWLLTEDDAEDAIDGAALAADLGADFLGILPPPRGQVSDDDFETWLHDIAAAAEDAGVTVVLHHHGGAHIEQPDEIREWLDRTPDSVELLFDTAHYHPYGDVVEGIERYADDIAYVHLKDIASPAGFETHVENLTAGKVDFDSIINFIWAFRDLGEGELDFEAIDEALADVGYDGHQTIEIENRRERPLVHAKQNVDHHRSVTE
ncbi:sugar phosphate isomerase/epimerase family protein [Haloarcula nitratireducens]|uniref:Sugar phosphate isomerase/epimerase n=1 Tax=Haloarcula nitratireducens TaxID=2487749 RepID=A0AAW4PEC7_9EURY|nr:sugar phosphate isomerase/epimerase [Halomicroarcula nitratireducens]MBX0296174.1 sugar phosphate isomerase/epimerase [Halomicroarcula nitratireducens]